VPVQMVAGEEEYHLISTTIISIEDTTYEENEYQAEQIRI